jgi:hypothetical protein
MSKTSSAIFGLCWQLIPKPKLKEGKLKRMNESTTRPLPNLRSLNIQGRLWFDKANGTSYHALRIWANGRHLIDIGMTYGYEDMYLHTDLVWLKKWQIIHEDTQ